MGKSEVMSECTSTRMRVERIEIHNSDRRSECLLFCWRAATGFISYRDGWPAPACHRAIRGRFPNTREGVNVCRRAFASSAGLCFSLPTNCTIPAGVDSQNDLFGVVASHTAKYSVLEPDWACRNSFEYSAGVASLAASPGWHSHCISTLKAGFVHHPKHRLAHHIKR
jgi:hypothetical protein